LRVRLIVSKKSFSNIYAKAVHKEYSTPHELHPITSARELEGALKASPEALGLTAFSLTKRRNFIDLNYLFINAVGARDTVTSSSRFC